VRVHDFAIPGLGKVAPYGVYDIAANTGWINLDITHDTAAFAVESIRRWWQELGQARYPQAQRTLITADCGGSNGALVRHMAALGVRLPSWLMADRLIKGRIAGIVVPSYAVGATAQDINVVFWNWAKIPRTKCGLSTMRTGYPRTRVRGHELHQGMRIGHG
jgi:hypothetical protein